MYAPAALLATGSEQSEILGKRPAVRSFRFTSAAQRHRITGDSMKDAMRIFTALILTAAAAFAGDSREDAARKLEMKISVDFRGVKLSEAMPVFREATGLSFIVEEGSETFVRLTLKDVSAKSALRLILEPAGLGAAFEHGVVVIRSRQSLAGAMTLRIYDVRSMMVKLKDFPGPRVELGGRPPGSLSFG
jgi:hypothetical protein